MKIDTSKVKRWTVLKINNNLYKVVDISHTHMARWWATYTFKVKDIISWKTNVFTYNSWTILEQADIQTNTAVYLYNDWTDYFFMENDTWEMYNLNSDMIDDILWYLKENLDVYLMIYEWNVIWVILPTTIEYKITSTVPWIKWNRAQSWTKPATIETWIEIQVPLHKNEWDIVVLNTLTWETN